MHSKYLFTLIISILLRTCVTSYLFLQFCKSRSKVILPSSYHLNPYKSVWRLWLKLLQLSLLIIKMSVIYFSGWNLDSASEVVSATMLTTLHNTRTIPARRHDVICLLQSMQLKSLPAVYPLFLAVPVEYIIDKITFNNLFCRALTCIFNLHKKSCRPLLHNHIAHSAYVYEFESKWNVYLYKEFRLLGLSIQMCPAPNITEYLVTLFAFTVSDFQYRRST